MSDDNGGIGFWKRLGIVCGAMLAAFALVSAIMTFMMTFFIVPAIGTVVGAEREARVRSDSILTVTMAKLSRDQVVLLALLAAPPTRRPHMLHIIRQKEIEPLPPPLPGRPEPTPRWKPAPELLGRPEPVK